AELTATADSSAVTTNLWGERWSKLGVNCMRNPIAAATGRGGNANDHDPATRRLSIGLAAEAVQVGRAHGYQFDKLYGIAADDLLATLDGDAAAFERCEARILEGTRTRSDDGRPSMGQDIAKGRRTEIDHLNGFVAARASDVGLAAPLNAGIAAIVREVETGAAAPSPKLLRNLTNHA
ncbi:MAG: ketopantoate reductase C-terminal domain-containing protein, partial [Pseudomonadota bacterium]